MIIIKLATLSLVLPAKYMLGSLDRYLHFVRVICMPLVWLYQLSIKEVFKSHRINCMTWIASPF